MIAADDLFEVLVCPRCKGELEYKSNESVLICYQCELGYPVKDGVPIMLIDLAHKIGDSGNQT